MTASMERQAQNMRAALFDFSEPAELYGARSRSGRTSGVTYRKFDTAAEAIRHVVEELSNASQRPCTLEVNEKRFNYIDIRNLYDSSAYPLPKADRKDRFGKKTKS